MYNLKTNPLFFIINILIYNTKLFFKRLDALFQLMLYICSKICVHWCCLFIPHKHNNTKTKTILIFLQRLSTQNTYNWGKLVYYTGNVVVYGKIREFGSMLVTFLLTDNFNNILPPLGYWATVENNTLERMCKPRNTLSAQDVLQIGHNRFRRFVNVLWSGSGQF